MAWKFELLKLMKNKEYLLYSDDDIAIIRDGYPKSEVHYLVLPKADIPYVKDIKAEHLDILKKMDLKGREYARENGGGRTFRYGYHAVPSMVRLHLHVISDDFNSPSLKNKKHWNSFNTPFFIDSSKVISDVESLGRVKLPSESQCDLYLKTPLKCHKCDFTPKNLPDLKKHLSKSHE